MPVAATQTCTSRRYVYDADSNRTQEISYPDAGTNSLGATCSTSTTPTSTLTHSYDQADRETDTGYVYDTFGRTTTVPAADAGGTALTVGYNADDMVAAETQGSTTRTYALDPARRIRSWTQGSTTSTNHYTDGTGDSPAWIGVTGGTWTRNVHGLGTDLAATQDSTGTVTLQLADIHGNIVATADDSTSAASTSSFQETNEFGKPYNPATAYPRYGWLGAKERSHDTLSGVILMGARLYNPTTGRFLQTDPVPGGSDNPYDYAHQDPYNGSDLDGQCNCGITVIGTTPSVQRFVYYETLQGHRINWYRPGGPNWPSNTPYQWKRNKKWLRNAIQHGDTIYAVDNPYGRYPNNQGYTRELAYAANNGVSWHKVAGTTYWVAVRSARTVWCDIRHPQYGR